MDDQHEPELTGDEFETAASKTSDRKAKKKGGRDYQAEYERRKERREAAARGDETPKPRRGRPPGSGRKAKATVSSEPIDPRHVAGMLGFFGNLIAQRLGVTPLSAEEIEEGGKALAPVVDHYAPSLAERIGVWGPAIYWGMIVVTPRVMEYSERRKAFAQAGADAEGEPDKGPRFRDAPSVDTDDEESGDAIGNEVRRPAFTVGPVAGVP